MPFGKYKDRPVAELDDSYLTWLYSLDDLREPLRTWVKVEFIYRFQTEHEDDATQPPPARASELIESGFRALARIYHPDVGGTDQAMCELLEARTWLMGVIKSRGDVE
jgi:hypothetical protein